MKGLILTLLLIQLTACNFTKADIYSDTMEFDWMPHPVVWEHNIRTCRAQAQCNAADLFQR